VRECRRRLCLACARGLGSVPSFCGGSLSGEGEYAALSARGRVCAPSPGDEGSRAYTVPPTGDSFTGVSTVVGEGGGDEGVNSCGRPFALVRFGVPIFGGGRNRQWNGECP
jgi:hypothetical protein